MVKKLEGAEGQKRELEGTAGQKQEEENKERQKLKLKEIAENIAAEPLEWVLFLGNGISYRKDYPRTQLYELAKKLAADDGVKDSVKSALYEAVQDKDDRKISGILFGNIWDNASFLEEQQEKQQDRRSSYAEELVTRDQVNVDWKRMHLKQLIKIFSGMILTTCQDETVEAFLEYQKSMPVDDLVCTPYIMNTSSRWDYWLQTGRGDITRFLSEEEMQEDVYILVKLYGSRNMPHRMLLSGEDFEAYYPNQPEERTRMKDFLEIVFKTKNVLFLGMEFDEKGNPVLAEGILKLLEGTKEAGAAAQGKKVRRYAVGNCLDARQLEKYQIEPVCGAGAEEMLSIQCENLQKRKLPEKEKLDEDKKLSGEEVLEQFGRHYVRRPFKGIFPKERHEDSVDELMKKELEILKKDILRVEDAENGPTAWCHMSVWQLAAAANNLADFYDLKQIFKEAEQKEEEKNPQGGGDIGFYKHVTSNILTDRLSEKSRNLYTILSEYGKGFPWGFLQFLSKDEDDLKEWKRAGIRLANSGIYRRRHKTIQKRMSYADRVMQTAGEYKEVKRKQFKNQIEQICQQAGNSYFYPFENVLIDQNMEKQEVQKLFAEMFHRMLKILKDKREGYQQLHSLLQTETGAVFDLINKMGDCDQELEWMPLLVHSLLLESRMMPVEYSRLDEILKQFRKITEGWKKDAGQAESKKIFETEMYLNQIEIIKWSHLLGGKEQGQKEKDAESKIMHKFEDEDGMLEKKTSEYGGQDTGILPEWLYGMQAQYIVLKCRIYDRLSSVAEIAYCRQMRYSSKKRKEEPDGRQGRDSHKKQKEELKNMDKQLRCLEKLIRDREEMLGLTYEMLKAQLSHIRGRYYFKMSQFYWENRKYAGNLQRYGDYPIEEWYYQKGEEAYEQALRYYSKYPSQYGIQRADVMRDLADLNCQKYKSLEGVDKGLWQKKCEKERGRAQERCYDKLMEAYILYRNNSDLHGIADVLQSMGNAESFANLGEQIEHRSPFSFHEAAKNIYKYLRDEWSSYVVTEFVEGVLYDRRDEPAAVNLHG